jgi:hypothetical protein
MKVGLLTTEQASLLIGKTYDGVQYYNPVPDINGDMFIFEEEVTQTTAPELMWVHDLQPTTYTPLDHDTI